MKSFSKFRLFAALAILAVFATSAVHAELVQGDELKALIVTEKGSTWTLSDGARLTFFPNGQLIDCNGKPGWESCDDGTYVFTDYTVERKYNNWNKNTGGARSAAIKREDGNFIFNQTTVVKYSLVPTLVPATKEQIMSLAGKNFKINYRDEGPETFNFSKEMNIFDCTNARTGCGTTAPLTIEAPWVSYYYMRTTVSGKALIVVEDGAILWNGCKLIPQ